ncbi:MAG: hypothetical protein OEV58_15445 [Gammaproteobacteria bacterium]|nr:hypothetical protein [Gammaproteobacteria bacterium]
MTLALIAHPTPAVEGLDAIAKSAIQDGVITIVCGDKQLLDLSGLNFDTCLRKSERHASVCWQAMQPLIPDLEFGTEEFSEKEDLVLSTLFILEKCIQSSILLATNGQGDTDSNGAHSPDAQARQFDSAHADAIWLAFIDNARSEYADKEDLLKGIAMAMAASNISLLIDDGLGRILGFSIGEDGSLTPVTENMEPWGERLASANLQSVTRSESGINFAGRMSTQTELHELVASYDSNLKLQYPQCAPEFTRIPCGSCEAARSTSYLVIVSWFLRKMGEFESSTRPDGDIMGSHDHQNLRMQCWIDGMSQLGIDARQLSVPNN